MKKGFNIFVDNLKKKLLLSGGASRYRWMKIGIYLGISILIFGIVYSSFFNEDTWEGKVSENKEELVEEDIVNLGMSPIRTMNPLVSQDEDVSYLTSLVYSSLFKLDETWTPVEDLVESYTFENGTIKLTLKDAKWEDGASITGEDIDFTVSAINYIGESSPYWKSVTKIKNIKHNGRDLEISFKSSRDVSLNYLTFPILPKHKYKNHYALKENKEDFVPVGSGIFKYKSYDKNKGLELEPNENYFGDKARSNIKISIIENEENKYSLVESGSISLLLSKDIDRSGKVTKKGIKTKDVISNQMEILAFNTVSEKMKNKHLRKAISYSVDFESIIEEDYYNSAKNSKSIFLNGYMGTKFKRNITFDKDKARKFLKKAGYEDLDEDGSVEDKKGDRLSFSILVDKNNSMRLGAVEKIKNSLDSIGVSVDVEALENDKLIEKLKNKDFDVALVGMSFDNHIDYRSLLYSGDRNNIASYSNGNIDKKFDSIYSGKTKEEAKKEIEEIEKILEEDTPYYCICYRTYGIVKAPVFSGKLKSTFISPYMEAETWYSTYRKRL